MKTQIKTEPNIRFTVTFTLDEVQARALDALAGYGASPFLRVFYRHMGTHYMQPHEGGLRRLFRAVTEQIRPELARIDKMRVVLAKGMKGRAPRVKAVER